MILFSVVFSAMAAVANAFSYQEGYSRGGDLFGEAELNHVSIVSYCIQIQRISGSVTPR